MEDLLRGLLLSVRILITCSSSVVKELSRGDSENTYSQNEIYMWFLFHAIFF